MDCRVVVLLVVCADRGCVDRVVCAARVLEDQHFDAAKLFDQLGLRNRFRGHQLVFRILGMRIAQVRQLVRLGHGLLFCLARRNGGMFV